MPHDVVPERAFPIIGFGRTRGHPQNRIRRQGNYGHGPGIGIVLIVDVPHGGIQPEGAPLIGDKMVAFIRRLPGRVYLAFYGYGKGLVNMQHAQGIAVDAQADVRMLKRHPRQPRAVVGDGNAFQGPAEVQHRKGAFMADTLLEVYRARGKLDPNLRTRRA